MVYDAIIIGGGAAGMFCAIEAGKRGRRVLVIEHNAEVGRKIIISGGGRCNFTNVDVGPENFVSRNPHFAKSALARYTPQDFIGLVKKHNIPFYEKKLGQLFCRDRSRAIVDMLLAECEQACVEIKTGCPVNTVRRSDVFEVDTSQGTVRTRSLVIACGGLSFPKVGATDLGYRIARQFGLSIVETRPSLVALVSQDVNLRVLAGVSVDACVSVGKRAFRENILFTHRGLSGPAILQCSNYWHPDHPVTIDLLPEMDAGEILAAKRTSRQTLANLLGKELPQRLADVMTETYFSNKPLDQISHRDITHIATFLNGWQVRFSGTEGYDRAEVTLGGVSTDELSSQTMESKKVPGLYFIGEVVDVTGWLGGYNFQWAWSSAYACGNSI